jgi:hypothetical protein
MDIDEYLNSDFSCEVEYYQGKPKIVILRNGKRKPILPWRRTVGFMASRALVLREPRTAQIMQRFCDSEGTVPPQNTTIEINTRYADKAENRPYKGKSVLYVSGKCPFEGTRTGLNGGRLLVHVYLQAFECIMDKLDEIYKNS